MQRVDAHGTLPGGNDCLRDLEMKEESIENSEKEVMTVDEEKDGHRRMEERE
jgi:hypothetical protein